MTMQTRQLSTTLPRPRTARNGHRPRRIIYPESDGKPMGESGTHVRVLFHGYSLFGDFLADDPFVLVAINNFLYYEKGNPRACVAPDLYIVKGVPKEPPRDSYKLWVEKIPPCFIIEYTSPSTAAEDRRKLALYARLGVAECFLHDPRQLKRRRTPVLQGLRLGADGYEPIPQEPDGGLTSLQIGVRLIVENGRLEVYDLASGRRLLDSIERAALERARAIAEAERATVEAERAALESARATAAIEDLRLAEARIAELEARLRESPPSAES